MAPITSACKNGHVARVFLAAGGWGIRVRFKCEVRSRGVLGRILSRPRSGEMGLKSSLMPADGRRAPGPYPPLPPSKADLHRKSQ